MVVSDGKNQLAVECDGDRYHPAEQIPNDLARQAVLERAGWRFVRIRGTRFFRDPESTLKAVVEEIEHLGVRRGLDTTPKGTTEIDDGLKARVVRRAAEVMKENGWIQTADNMGPPGAAGLSDTAAV